jgi:hypothetical protein
LHEYTILVGGVIDKQVSRTSKSQSNEQPKPPSTPLSGIIAAFTTATLSQRSCPFPHQGRQLQGAERDGPAGANRKQAECKQLPSYMKPLKRHVKQAEQLEAAGSSIWLQKRRNMIVKQQQHVIKSTSSPQTPELQTIVSKQVMDMDDARTPCFGCGTNAHEQMARGHEWRSASLGVLSCCYHLWFLHNLVHKAIDMESKKRSQPDLL